MTLVQQNINRLIQGLAQNSLHTRSHTGSEISVGIPGDLRTNAAIRGGQRESTVFLSEFSMFQPVREID